MLVLSGSTRLGDLNAIVSIVPDAMILIDDQQRIVLYNEAAETMFGWSQDEVLDKPLGILIPERFRTIHKQQTIDFSRAPGASRKMAGHRPAIVGLRKNGEEFPAEASISKIDVAGSRLFTVTLRDISERRRFEDALRTSEERLRVSLQASPAVVFNQDLQLRYTWIHNPKQPFATQDLLGKTDFDLLPRPDAEHVTAIKRRVLETGTGAREIVRTTIQSEAVYYDLTVEPLRNGIGRIVGITCATWDITDRMRIEYEQRLLAEAGSVFMSTTLDHEATLAELSQLGTRDLADLCIIDVIEGDHVRRLRVACSDPSKRILADALEKTHVDRHRPHLMFDALEARRATLVTDVTPEYLESVAQNSEYRHLLRALEMRSLITVPLLARGRLLGAFALISSRESRRYGERELRLAKELARIAALAMDNAQLNESARRASAAREEVIGIVAHDLRNPLSTIIMQLDRVRRCGADVERGQKSVDAIARAALRMNRLIQDMLDVTRLEAGGLAMKRTTVATQNLLDEVLEAQREKASKSGLRFRVDLGERLPDVFADRDRLLQVFDNLIGNAIKFTTPGGEIVVGAVPRSAEVLFWVKDTGPGISSEHLPHLFDRFWQATKTDRRGAGLGLPITKGIIEAHGGQVRVESEIGKGTTFTFAVPTASPADTHSPRLP